MEFLHFLYDFIMTSEKKQDFWQERQFSGKNGIDFFQSGIDRFEKNLFLCYTIAMRLTFIQIEV